MGPVGTIIAGALGRMQLRSPAINLRLTARAVRAAAVGLERDFVTQIVLGGVLEALPQPVVGVRERRSRVERVVERQRRLGQLADSDSGKSVNSGSWIRETVRSKHVLATDIRERETVCVVIPTAAEVSIGWPRVWPQTSIVLLT